MSYKKIGTNKYKVDVEITANGERFRKSKRVTTSLKSAALKAFINSVEIELYKELEIKASSPDKLKKLKYVEYVKYYLENINTQESTKEYYEFLLLSPRAIDHFQRYELQKITKQIVDRFHKILKETISDRTKKPLSKKTIKHYHTSLTALFNHAIEKKVITENPVQFSVVIPRNTIKIGFYEPSEIKTIGSILSEENDLELELYFNMTIITGMRPSEVRALEWKKIDFETGCVTVNEAIVKTKKGYIRKSTKTEDTRVQQLTGYVIYLLEKHKEAQKVISSFVFTDPLGGCMKENTTKGKWRKFCKKHGIRYVAPYGLRHSSATLLAYNNVPLPDIASHMGHTSLSTTNIYIHATSEGREQIKGVMEDTTKPTLKLVK